MYSCFGSPKIWPASPISTILPSFMIAMRSQVSASTPRSCEMRISARPRPSRSRSRSCRICACITTSSAVVGSSAMTSGGLHASASADHCTLSLAARELVREAPGGVRRQADRRHQLVDPLAHLGLARVAIVEVDRLSDLVVHALHRVERVHRALEDQRDVAPAHHLHAPLGAPPDVDLLRHGLGPQGDRPGLGQRRRQEPHHRKRRGRLPAARLAGQPERLALSQLEADPVDDRRAVAGGDSQVRDLEERGAHPACCSRRRGLMYSSKR